MRNAGKNSFDFKVFKSKFLSSYSGITKDVARNQDFGRFKDIYKIKNIF